MAMEAKGFDTGHLRVYAGKKNGQTHKPTNWQETNLSNFFAE